MHKYCRGSHTTHHACTQKHTHTQRNTCTIPAFMQTQWFSSHTQTVASLLCSRASLHSSLLLLLSLFTKQHRTPLSPRGERAKFTRGAQGISGSVVCWWTAPLWLGTRGQGMAPKACWLLWCLCVWVCLCMRAFVLAFVCVLALGCMTPCLLMLRESHKLFFVANESHMTAQHAQNLFIHTVNYSIWLVLVCDVRVWDGGSRNSLLIGWVTLRDILTTEFHFIPHHSLSSLSSLTAVNSGNTQSLIRLGPEFSPKCPWRQGILGLF